MVDGVVEIELMGCRRGVDLARDCLQGWMLKVLCIYLLYIN